jgi:hypothetical protein
MNQKDTMQVCLNGHVITDLYNSRPDLRKKFCSECGAETITNCPNCHVPIPGEYINNSFVMIGFDKFAPKICENCGTKFPWFDLYKQQDEEEKQKIKEAEEGKKQLHKKSTAKKIEVKIEGHGNVVNLGSMIDNVISNSIKLNQSGDEKIATALENLTKAINSESTLGEKEKGQYLEQLQTLSEEAIKPVDKRLPKSVLKTVIDFGLGSLSAIGKLSTAWTTWGPAIKTFFLD